MTYGKTLPAVSIGRFYITIYGKMVPLRHPMVNAHPMLLKLEVVQADRAGVTTIGAQPPPERGTPVRLYVTYCNTLPAVSVSKCHGKMAPMRHLMVKASSSSSLTMS